MFKIIFTIYLIAHLLGDFYFQSENLANKKEEKYGFLLLHCLIYTITCFIISVFVNTKEIYISVAIIAISHFLIDSLKFVIIKRTHKNNKYFFIVDQLLHLLVIFILGYINCKQLDNIAIVNFIKDFLETINICNIRYLYGFTILLLIGKPSNILIRELLDKFKPKETNQNIEVIEDNKTKINNKAGRIIGALERILIFILFISNQMGAIAIVIGAKTLARYNKISTNKEFAEYYLLGTLLSMILVFASCIILL